MAEAAAHRSDAPLAAGLRASSVSGTMLARVCVLIAGLATGIVSARVLGPAGRGQYFAITTAAAIIAQVANLGLASSNVFLGARDRTRLPALLINSTTLALTVGVLTAAAVAVAGARLADFLSVPQEMLWALCVLGAAVLLWNLATTLLAAAERFAALNTWQVINAVLTALTIGACALLRLPASAFVLAAALAALFTATALALFIARRFAGPLRFSGALIREGLGFSVRAYFALVFGYLLQRAGASLLVAQSTAAELGQYSIASQVFDVLLIVPTSISTVLYPLLVRRSDDLWHHVRRTALATAAAMLVLSAAAALVAPYLLPLVFGARYGGAAPALWGLLPTVMAYSIVSVLSQYLVARGFPWAVVFAWAAGLAAALLAGLRLTPAYGAVGAAASQSVGAVLVCAVIIWLARRHARARMSDDTDG